MSYRNIWIGVGVATVIAAVGTLLFSGAAAPMQATAALSIIAGILVLHTLDDRELRERKRATDALILPPERRQRQR